MVIATTNHYAKIKQIAFFSSVNQVFKSFFRKLRCAIGAKIVLICYKYFKKLNNLVKNINR